VTHSILTLFNFTGKPGLEVAAMQNGGVRCSPTLNVGQMFQ